MLHWTEQAHRLYQDGCDSVQVSIVKLQGSGPRAAGSRMLVTADQVFYSIGGGNLEFQAIDQARKMLTQPQAEPHLQEFALGASRGQCCGGRVQLLFEPVFTVTAQLLLIGGGHVAQALAPLLKQMPLQLQWVDNRAQMPIQQDQHCRIEDDLSDAVAAMPAQSIYLIMTHDHALDLELSQQILKRNDARFLGVIGSRSKAARFQHQLRDRGFSPTQMQSFHCPLGNLNIKGKQPIEIAVSIAAQIIELYQQSTEQHLQSVQPA